MGHEITTADHLGLRREAAWHGMGQIINDDLSAVEFGERTGMFDPITGEPLFWKDAAGTYREVPTHRANVRRATAEEILLGIVGVDYAICQDRELAEFTDTLAQSGKVTIESAGSIRGGKRVWFLAKGEAFTIGDKDTIWPYLLVSNAHDGTQAIRVTPTTVRVVCSNTLHMVIPRDDMSERPETAAITIRHSGKIAEKMEEAKRALAYYGETLKRNREMFEAMQAKKVDNAHIMQLFANTYAANWEVATAEELTSTDGEVKRTAENRFARMEKASKVFLARYEAEKESLKLGDSLWAAFNAMTGFVQHDKGTRGTDDGDRVARRMESNLFGLNASRTHEVLAASLAMSV